MRVSDQDHQDIRQAIMAAERKTSGEIFCVIARASDDYAAFPALWAALAALIIPLFLLPLTQLSANLVYTAQLVVFVVIALLLSVPAIKPFAVPSGIKHRRARRNAVEQFLAHGLHMTRQRTGVLLFVSLAERHAEVVADDGINSRVEQHVWDDAVAALIKGARSDELGKGFVNAIGIVGSVLADHFPPAPGDDNELPDHLVVL